MTLSQYKGSTSLYNFVLWYLAVNEIYEYIITVLRAIVLKRTLLSGSVTSGNKARAGFIKSYGLNDIYSINFYIFFL
jgi:hypothetical protein